MNNFLNSIENFISRKNLFVILTAVILLGLMLRIASFFLCDRIDMDSIDYIMMANYLYNGQIADAVNIRIMYPVLYPLILCGGKYIGLDPVVFGAIISILSGVGVIYLTYFIVRHITNSVRISLLTTCLVAFNPCFVRSDSSVLRDAPGLFFGVLAFYILLVSIKRKYILLWILSGIISGITVLLRIEYLIIIAVIPLWLVASFLFFKNERREVIRYYLPSFISFLIAFMIITYPFQQYFAKYGSSFNVFPTSKMLNNFLSLDL